MTGQKLVRRWALAVVLGVAAATLSACTPPADSQPSSSAPVSGGESGSADGAADPTASATPDAAPAVFHPDGSADANLPIFTKTVQDVWAGESRAEGRAYIDALVAAGFADKTVMQLTPDQTQIGNAAESIQFSVRWAGACLVGQVGPATGQPNTYVAPLLPNDTCLIGATRAIDW